MGVPTGVLAVTTGTISCSPANGMGSPAPPIPMAAGIPMPFGYTDTRSTGLLHIFPGRRVIRNPVIRSSA
eukprot:13158896-Alexandrium_andersonii.AAC.1